MDCTYSSFGCTPSTIEELHCVFSDAKHLKKYSQYCMVYLASGELFEAKVGTANANMLGLTFNAIRLAAEEWEHGQCSKDALDDDDNPCPTPVSTNTGVIIFHPDYDTSETWSHEHFHSHGALVMLLIVS
ncbi:hypothetical protein Ddc_19583 [Ditylenchus destructor]|nr:hypothetical protein Ddc_19583 [Ditylenchus destructor]